MYASWEEFVLVTSSHKSKIYFK